MDLSWTFALHYFYNGCFINMTLNITRKWQMRQKALALLFLGAKRETWSLYLISENFFCDSQSLTSHRNNKKKNTAPTNTSARELLCTSQIFQYKHTFNTFSGGAFLSFKNGIKYDEIWAHFLWLSVKVMPCDDTLKWTTVAVGAGLDPMVSEIALAMACGPVKDSISTEFMYRTLHAGN